MSEPLIKRLRGESGNALAQEAADGIETLAQTVEKLLQVSDKMSALLAGEIAAPGSLDVDLAMACTDSVRGAHAELGRTPLEAYLQKIYDRLAAAVGIPSEQEFNPLAVLDQLRVVLSAQQQNAAMLELILSWNWTPGSDTVAPTLLVGADKGQLVTRTFPISTQWFEALGTILAENKAAAAPAVDPA